MKPLVSILIPAFNAQRCIADTIASALGQTWERKEIIVVDDGSTDQTLVVARRFESAGIKVITQANQGAAAARNTAFTACRGDYIQWLDADDLLDSDKIEKQVSVLSKCRSSRTLLSSAWGTFYHRPDRAAFCPTPLWRDLSPVEWMLENLNPEHWMQTAVWLVSRELTEAAGPWDSKLLGDDDGEYFFRVIQACEGIRFVREARVFYRKPGPGNLSSVGRSRAKLNAQWISMELHVRHIRALEDSPRVRCACVKYLQDYLIYFYPEMPEIVEKANRLATDLGGQLKLPQMSWKYAWIQKLFGWTTAKRSQLYYNRCKSALLRSWARAEP